ncbi:hypothetical protein, partial [Escherichia coli]|uniref:hypothetical protein n=1 Tax=Escherichia coli TaxID=562 RepID=UPI001BE4AEEA
VLLQPVDDAINSHKITGISQCYLLIRKNEHSGCICNSAVAVIFCARKQVTTSGGSLQKAKCQHFVQSFNMFNTLCAPTL